MRKNIYITFFIFIIAHFQVFGQDTITVIGVGDMMLGSNYPSEAYLPPNQGKDLLAEVNEILQNATITFGNLEGTVLNSGGTIKKCSNPNICYAFRMPEYLIDNLVRAGFDVLSIANNHVGDFGEEGKKNAVKVLKEKGLYYAGLTSCPTVVFEKNGIRFGLVAFAPNNGTVNINDLPNAVSLVKELSTKADIVIVSFHGGAEGTNHQHVKRKTETFYGENRGNVYDFAHKMIDAGADIIFGHGPHVTRAVEVYKDRFIAYSLGNFCTYKQFNIKGVSGLAPIIKVFTDKQGKFFKAQITPIYQPPPGGVAIDKEKRVIQVIKNLTKTDFPEVPIKIDDNGLIIRK
ncbi:MAG: CapA family protein [Thermoflexibacter sp.]|nr:CapA family protein [Thermoflexibacter sp.]